MFQSSIYTHSPTRIQEFLISGRSRVRMGLREGKSYRNYLARAREREYWSAQRIAEYQVYKLRDLLGQAARLVPHYSAEFQRIGFRPSEAELPESVSALPILNKRKILESGDDLIAKGWWRGKIGGSTSGTTGTPVTIYQDLSAVCRENAFIARQLAWSGYKAGEPRVWLRGDMVVPSDCSKAPYWRMNRAENMLMMSSYHLSESTADDYLRALSNFGPTMIQAYPSSISYLARFLDAKDRYYQSPELRSVVTSSESLSPEDLSLVETRFGCRVFDWYGAFERVAAIGTCEEGTYHLLTDYSYVELDSLGEGQFEMIGTGFNNLLMPLIRFRTGDVIEMPEDQAECKCGRSFPVVSRIYGRMDDYVKLSDGRRIGRLDHIFKGLTGIAEAQIVQDELDSIRVLLVPFGSFSESERHTLISNARARLGQTVEIEVEIVTSIERASNGKFRSVVCNV